MTTIPPLLSLVLISPSLALALRNTANDLNPECLISTGVFVVFVSWKERYGRMYVSWKIDGVMGKDPDGSFDSVVAIDSRRADLRATDTSATF